MQRLTAPRGIMAAMSRRYDPDFDAYAALEVSPNATQEEIEAAYRRAALKWHPDKSTARDAADRFHDVQAAGELVRDPTSRREYDRIHGIHRWQGPPRPDPKASEARTPMRPPPAWLAERVKVHFDSALFQLDLPRPPGRSLAIANFIAAFILGIAVVKANAMGAVLALVVYAIGRVIATPPHRGHLAWAKITPSRMLAEYHSLDQTSQVYQRREVPFQRLAVAVVRDGNTFRIEIRGFPHDATPVLTKTRDLREAQRFAREAGRWLHLPTAA